MGDFSGVSRNLEKGVRTLGVIGVIGTLLISAAGCATKPPTPSMAPGPSPDHGLPGVSVPEGHSQWPPAHVPQGAQDHRIYSESSPSVPSSLPPPKPKPAPIAPAHRKKSQPGPLQKSVYFSFNSARLTYWDKVVLDHWAANVKKTPVRLLLLHGSTDPLGSEVYNRKLGLWRSLSVKRYLVSRGIPAKKIKALSWGDRKSKLFSSCRKRSPLCHSQSRSVRIDVILGKKPSAP